MNTYEKGFAPQLTHAQKLESIRSQRDSIAKILSQLEKQEAVIKGRTKQS